MKATITTLLAAQDVSRCLARLLAQSLERSSGVTKQMGILCVKRKVHNTWLVFDPRTLLLLVSQGYNLTKTFFDVDRYPRQFVVGRSERCRDAHCILARSLHVQNSVNSRKAPKQSVGNICQSHICLVVVVRKCKSTSSLQCHTS